MPECDSAYHECHVRVRYADTDAMGVVYYGEYLAYFETGRVELMRAMGADYHTLEAEGYAAPVVEVVCRYHAPAYFDDLLTVRTRVAEMKRATVVFEYEVWRDADGTLVASGRTRHGCVSRDTLRPVPFPPRFRAAVNAFQGQAPRKS